MQKDRQDTSAVGWEHKEKLQQHASQKGKDKLREQGNCRPVVTKPSSHIKYKVFSTALSVCRLIGVCCVCYTDHATGFGGKYGVQKDRVDKVSGLLWSKIQHCTSALLYYSHECMLFILTT